MDEQPGSVGDDAPLCLGDRGAAPPQHCGGPTGYRLILKRQRMGEAMCTPVQMEAVLAMLAASDPEASPETWRSYRQILQEGFRKHRLPAERVRPAGAGALQPERSQPASGPARGDAYEGPQQRVGGRVPALVPPVSPQGSNDWSRTEGRLTPGLARRSRNSITPLPYDYLPSISTS